jgi:hypothetical protein
MNEREWEVISVYTRAQAIADGVLEDVSEQARGYGFVEQTCVSTGVSALLHADSSTGESLEGRLHDLLFLCSVLMKNRKRPSSGPLPFGFRTERRLHTLWLMHVRGEGWTILDPADY